MSIFSKLGDLIPGVLRKVGLLVIRLGDVLPLVDDLLKLGIAERDVPKVEAVCDSLDDTVDHLQIVIDQMKLATNEVREAVGMSSEGGRDITLGEFREEIMPEFVRLGELAGNTDEVVGDLIEKLKALR